MPIWYFWLSTQDGAVSLSPIHRLPHLCASLPQTPTMTRICAHSTHLCFSCLRASSSSGGFFNRVLYYFFIRSVSFFDTLKYDIVHIRTYEYANQYSTFRPDVFVSEGLCRNSWIRFPPGFYPRDRPGTVVWKGVREE